MCLTSGPLEILPSTTDPLSRIYKFIGDLRTKVTKLCEQQLDICPKVRKQTIPFLSNFLNQILT